MVQFTQKPFNFNIISQWWRNMQWCGSTYSLCCFKPH